MMRDSPGAGCLDTLAAALCTGLAGQLFLREVGERSFLVARCAQHHGTFVSLNARGAPLDPGTTP